MYPLSKILIATPTKDRQAQREWRLMAEQIWVTTDDEREQMKVTGWMSYLDLHIVFIWSRVWNSVSHFTQMRYNEFHFMQGCSHYTSFHFIHCCNLKCRFPILFPPRSSNFLLVIMNNLLPLFIFLAATNSFTIIPRLSKIPEWETTFQDYACLVASDSDDVNTFY